jgi:hypothetical protein
MPGEPTVAEKIQILQEFTDKLLSSQEDLPPEIADLVNKHFLELI